jgi:hypothetical protein
MANRAEEKERRRQERLAAQQAEKKAAARKRAFGLIGGIGLAVVAVAVVVLLLTNTGGDGADASDASALRRDAAAAGCEFRQADSEGRDHIQDDLTKAAFKTNPPTSGDHNPVPAQDGYYQPGNEPAIGNWVHSLEHGRILFQFKKGATPQQIQQLRDLADEEINGTAGYHTLVFQNNTDMPRPFAAVAWTRYVMCNDLTPDAVQVMRDFRETYTDQAPELVP